MGRRVFTPWMFAMSERLSIDFQLWVNGELTTFCYDTGLKKPLWFPYRGSISLRHIDLVSKIGNILEQAGLTHDASKSACVLPESGDDECGYNGVVYFVRTKGADLMKIGYSTSLDNRLKALQTSSPFPLFLFAKMPGDESIESKIHQEFSHLRMTGEWFRIDGELVKYIKENATIETYEDNEDA